ncbi:MAG: pectinesterase family protein, partial [Clostridia bacterium]
MIYNVNPTDNLQEVVNNAEPNSAIILSSGIYHQKFVITTPNLTLTSSTSSAKDVVIVYDDFAKKLDDCGREYNTFRTYTVAIATDNVTLSNITIANSNTKPSVVGQCVALSVCGSNFVADNCIFTSTQDTLFCAPLPDDLVIRYLDFLPTNLNYIEGETVQKYIN